MTQAYDRLKELFQFDREDLDFGIYRITNQKRAEVLRFLDKDLKLQVEDAFNEYRAGDEAQVRRTWASACLRTATRSGAKTKRLT